MTGTIHRAYSHRWNVLRVFVCVCVYGGVKIYICLLVSLPVGIAQEVGEYIQCVLAGLADVLYVSP